MNNRNQNNGYPQGYDPAWNNGYPQGYDPARNNGYPQGYDPARNNGYPQGYDPAQNNGYPQGYDPARNNGYPQGYDPARNNGYPQGYNNYQNNVYGYYQQNGYPGTKWNEPYYGRRDPRIPEKIFREHPDARIATKKEGLRAFILSSLVFGVMILVFGISLVLGVMTIAETNRIINCNETVEGVVTKTWKSTKSNYKSSKISYYASYEYTYHNKTYVGKTKMRAGQLSAEEKITVYVDPNNPSDSRVFPVDANFIYLLPLMLVPFIIFWCIMFREYRLCRQGRIVIYKSYYSKNGSFGKTIWKKIP